MVNQNEEPKLIEKRLISGEGLFKLEYNEAYRYFWLYASIVRLPVTNFNNNKWNPDRSEYAKITWNNDEFVIREDLIRYEAQRLEWCVDPTGDASFASVCLYDSVIFYLDYLAPFVSAPPLPDDNDNKIFWTFLKNYFDKILISCRDDTAIEFELWGLKFNKNCPTAVSEPSKKPGSPPPKAKVPPGTPIGNISPPYDPVTNDNGNTKPFSSDIIPAPEPTGNACQSYVLQITYFRDDIPGMPFTIRAAAYGVLGSIEARQGDGIYVECQGDPATQPCQGFGFYRLYSIPQAINNVTYVVE